MQFRAESSLNWFRQNWFPKLEHFDWLIVKLFLLLANQNAQILEICFDEIILWHRGPLRWFTDHWKDQIPGEWKNGYAGEFGPTEWLKLSAVSTFFMLKVFQLKKITMGAIGSNTVKEALRLELVFPVYILQISDIYVILSVKF